MPVDEALLELMVDEVQWSKKNGQDAWQNATYEPAVPVRAYCVDDVHTVQNEQGEKQVAAGTVYTADVYGIVSGDKLVLNGRELGDIIRIVNHRDEKGPYGSEIHHG